MQVNSEQAQFFNMLRSRRPMFPGYVQFYFFIFILCYLFLVYIRIKGSIVCGLIQFAAVWVVVLPSGSCNHC